MLCAEVARNDKPKIAVGQSIYIVDFHWLIWTFVHCKDLNLIVSRGYFKVFDDIVVGIVMRLCTILPCTSTAMPPLQSFGLKSYAFECPVDLFTTMIPYHNQLIWPNNVNFQHGSALAMDYGPWCVRARRELKSGLLYLVFAWYYYNSFLLFTTVGWNV